MTVIVYLFRGETLIFSEVSDLKSTPDKLELEYYGATLGEHRKASFWRQQISGFTYNAT